jgi:hypothetical protein
MRHESCLLSSSQFRDPFSRKPAHPTILGAANVLEVSSLGFGPPKQSSSMSRERLLLVPLNRFFSSRCVSARFGFR